MRLRVKIGENVAEASGSPSFVSGVIGSFYCLALRKHKRGKEVKPIAGYRLFRCPRCGGNERRYKIKPKAEPEGAK